MESVEGFEQTVLLNKCLLYESFFLKKCYLLCKNAPGRILVKLIALIASGKGIY